MHTCEEIKNSQAFGNIFSSGFVKMIVGVDIQPQPIGVNIKP
jgi:hypothetical protein